jgi:predicted chitinase
MTTSVSNLTTVLIMTSLSGQDKKKGNKWLYPSRGLLLIAFLFSPLV